MSSDAAAFLEFAEYLGVKNARIVYRNKRHQRLEGDFANKHFSHAIPNTPGDFRSFMNARSQLRRRLGLTHSGKRLRVQH